MKPARRAAKTPPTRIVATVMDRETSSRMLDLVIAMPSAVLGVFSGAIMGVAFSTTPSWAFGLLSVTASVFSACATRWICDKKDRSDTDDSSSSPIFSVLVHSVPIFWGPLLTGLGAGGFVICSTTKWIKNPGPSGRLRPVPVL